MGEALQQFTAKRDPDRDPSTAIPDPDPTRPPGEAEPEPMHYPDHEPGTALPEPGEPVGSAVT